MFTKEPNQRPSAVELLQSPLILQHRSVNRLSIFNAKLSLSFRIFQRIKINEPLENTVNAQRRLHELKSRLYVRLTNKCLIDFVFLFII